MQDYLVHNRESEAAMEKINKQKNPKKPTTKNPKPAIAYDIKFSFLAMY